MQVVLNPFTYVRSIISQEIRGFPSSGFVFVDKCREVITLALARNNGQRGITSGPSESDSDEISMTFIDFFVIGLEGEGEAI